MELMFVPAGGTGRYQINDTDLHKPFKDSVRFEACAWYRSMLKKLKANVAGRWYVNRRQAHDEHGHSTQQGP